MIIELENSLRDWLQASTTLGSSEATAVATLCGVIALVLLAVAVDRIVAILIRASIPWLLERFGSQAPEEWRLALRQNYVAKRTAHIVAAVVVYWLAESTMHAYPNWIAITQNLIEAYLVIAITFALTSLLSAGGDVFFDRELPTEISGRFATQACMIFTWVAGVVLSLAVLTDTSVTVVLSGLAGTTALLVIVFKDSILGFVAGLQIAMNKMLIVGDWIEIPQQEVNGNVVDIGLTTVRVQNFDKSISSVPSYSLVTQSFRNWRGMFESGVRRIKRAIYIDIDSVSFLSKADFERLRNFEMINDGGLDSMAEHQVGSTASADANERSIPGLVNLDVFREYVEAYLKRCPFVRQDMTILVRYLAPSPEGLPIEIYAYCKEQEWVKYERIQSEMVNHMIAVLPKFNLRPFQMETSNKQSS